MQHDDTVSAYILDTQIALFDDARHDLQLSIAEIARQAKLPIGTVNAWAQGRNAMSLWGIKKLLRVKPLAPLLSRFFAPESYALTGVEATADLDAIGEWADDFAAEKMASHRKDSEAAERIGPKEKQRLDTKVLQFPAKVKAA